MKTLLKEQFGQGSREVSAVADELATQPLDHLRNRGAIIDIAWRQAAREQFALVIDGQVQFEAKEPPSSAICLVWHSPKVSSEKRRKKCKRLL
jgi:hypothetical protein